MIAPTGKTTKGAAPNTFTYECGIVHEDGYTVRVDWNDESDCWIAKCDGMFCGDGIGTGHTVQIALCDLACALACLVDSFKESDA